MTDIDEHGVTTSEGVIPSATVLWGAGVAASPLGRAVAVKVIRPGSFGLGDTVKRFRKEARSLARLRHPGIVSIHEVGHAGDAIYFTMDWIEGGSLADRLCDGRLNAGETVRILAQVASAIAHTHERGIVHRDLKPANVLLDRDVYRMISLVR